VDVVEDDYDGEPLEDGWGTYGDYQLVGHGKPANEYCGKFLSFRGCIRVDLHGGSRLDGKDYSGKAFIRVVHHWCDKPTCPICFKHGWAVRAAGKIEGRLAEASKRFGAVEHIVVAIPPEFYGLSLEAMREKAKEVLYARGVIGGVVIFHGFRYNLRKYWYWSPHFHVLGHILGGYGCRGCEKCFKGCGGFVDRSYRCFEKDSCIVRVLGKRKTVFGTAWYQLNHASVKLGVQRFHVASWFGVCSYRKLKVTVERKKDLCPICFEETVRLHHLGSRPVVKDRNASGFVGAFLDDLFDNDGSANWVEAHSGSHKRCWSE
jgi:hypothetical protein